MKPMFHFVTLVPTVKCGGCGDPEELDDVPGAAIEESRYSIPALLHSMGWRMIGDPQLPDDVEGSPRPHCPGCVAEHKAKGGIFQ